MNDLKGVDEQLLEEVKIRIGDAAELGNPAEWTQKDYEFLVFYIEEKTGTTLSLSTIKRIWSNQYQRLPHAATRNALSQLAYGQDWNVLKKSRLERSPGPVVEGGKAPERFEKRSIPDFARWGFAIVLAGGLLAASIALKREEKRGISPEELTNVQFSCQTSVEEQVPNTVVFSYDVSGVVADSFFLQQSWDISRRVKLSPKYTTQTDIYYIPGYFTASLLADDQVIREIPVHITYPDWFVSARQPLENIVTFDSTDYAEGPFLGLRPNALAEQNIDENQPFQLGFYNVRDFGADGDNFTYSSRFRMDHTSSMQCPDLSLLIKGTQRYFWITFGPKGCESELGLRCSEQTFSGKNHDLTAFGTNMTDWQMVEVRVRAKQLQLFLNGSAIFETTYREDIGPLKEISYFFRGPGYIDDVELLDGNSQVRLTDSFEN